MATNQNELPQDPFVAPNGPWADRVQYSEHDLVAFRPRQLLCGDDEMRGQAVEVMEKLSGAPVIETLIFDGEWLLQGTAEFDVELAVTQLEERGIEVEPNVIFFNHSGACGGCCCQGMQGNPFNSNPFNSNPFNSNPFNSNPFNSNPFNSNPFNSNPFNSNPFNSNGWAPTGERPSSARPAPNPGKAPDFPIGEATAIIFDTGIASKTQLPDLLKPKDEHQDAHSSDREVPDLKKDGYLDASSGHGTFIAGIIERLAPNHVVSCARVLGNFGDGDAASISHRLDALLPQIDDNTILNMSFGSYGDPKLRLLSSSIRRAQDKGAVVVSSAGNDGTCLPSYPAALPAVVSTGSADAGGRASYSNYGNWVRACAPGTDVVSSFFKRFNGDSLPIPNVGDPDDFKQWARWTGTSFAAPIVVGALMRHMALTGVNAKRAVDALIEEPNLARLPGLGTVINLTPGM